MKFKFFTNPKYSSEKKFLTNTNQTKVSDKLLNQIIQMDDHEKKYRHNKISL